MKSVDAIISECFVGKVIKAFESGGKDFQEYIGKKIKQANIEVVDYDGGCGIKLFVEEIEEPVFIYSDENIDIS